MTYVFLCSKGHVTEHVCPVELRPEQVRCECGKTAKRMIVNPLASVMGLGKHGSTDATERAYGSAHVDGLIKQRDMTECMTAMGIADGHRGGAKSSWALPRPEGVATWKDKLKHGVKPPESATFGVKKEVLQSLGLE